MNIAYFDSLISQINGSQTCAELAAISAKISSTVSNLQSGITSQLAVLEGLVIVPTNLATALTWIEKVIATYLGPQAILIANQAILVTQLARVLAAIADKQAEIGC